MNVTWMSHECHMNVTCITLNPLKSREWPFLSPYGAAAPRCSTASPTLLRGEVPIPADGFGISTGHLSASPCQNNKATFVWFESGNNMREGQRNCPKQYWTRELHKQTLVGWLMFDQNWKAWCSELEGSELRLGFTHGNLSSEAGCLPSSLIK